MSLILLLLSLSGFAAATEAVDLRFEEKPAPVETPREKRRAKREQEKFDAERKKESAARMAEHFKSLSPETQRLTEFLSGQKVERCGLCREVSVDAGGLHCVEQVGKSYGKCGNACKEKILLIPASVLEGKGFKPAEGGLAAGKEALKAEMVTEALELAQIRRGYSHKKFMAPAVAVCR